MVARARKREIPWTQIAKDFGISEAAVHNWVKRADVADGLAVRGDLPGARVFGQHCPFEFGVTRPTN